MSDVASPFRVLIAGGGVAGLEALLALHDLLGERAQITVVTPESDFVYRPMAVAEPFARGHAKRHRLSEITARFGAELVPDRLESVDGTARLVRTAGGRELPYDALVVAIGAGAEPVYERALTWTPEADSEVYGGLLSDLESGYSKRLAFVIPDGVAWPLPGYELALMTAWDADAMGQKDVDITIYTHEQAPLGLFGPTASAAVAEDLAEAGVTVRTGAHVTESAGGLEVSGGDDLVGVRVVALPRAVGRPVAGLPADDQGFIPRDPYGQVPGTDAVWVAGDAAQFPIKQGGLAAQQADVVARAIAARAGADVEVEPFRPVLRGVLLTGRGRAWMRHELEGQDDAGTAARHALFWPPTKIAGRYLSPFLADVDDASEAGGGPQPSGEPVELDLQHEARQG